MKSLDEIKGDLSYLKDYEVVVFGSYAAKIADKRSDIDIAVKKTIETGAWRYGATFSEKRRISMILKYSNFFLCV